MMRIKRFDSINELVTGRKKDMSKEVEAELEFKEAVEKGRSSPNTDYLGDAWIKVSNKYKIYDRYYLYDDKILIHSRSESGNWYVDYLTLSTQSISEFKQEISNKIKTLEEALTKL